MPLSSLQPPIPELPTAPSLHPALSQSTMIAVRQGQVIENPVLAHLEQNVGLKDARDLIDTNLRSQPAPKSQVDEAQADAREGLLRWLTFLLAGGVGLAYFLM